MPDRELRDQIIEGLAACLPETGKDAAIGCEGCPYGCSKADAVRVPVTLLEDVRALLKAQEPRVMTLDEVVEHFSMPPEFRDDPDAQEDYYEDIQPLYFEYPYQKENPWNVHWRGAVQSQRYLDERRHTYNRDWRCWTAKPTDEQRKAVEWDG